MNTNPSPPYGTPLQDEFAPGYVGRLTALSSAADREIYFKDLRAQLAQQGLEIKGKHNEELLVHVHGLSHRDFIKNHSLIPYRWAVRDPLPPYKSGRRTRPASISKTSRSGAWFCPDCALKDKVSYGFSYWRRAHQLTGVDKCLEHRNTHLRMLDSASAFTQQPHLSIDSGIPAAYSFSAITECASILRFSEISVGLLSASYPKSPKAAQSLINSLTVDSGIYKGRIFAQPELLRHATETLPKEWLEANFPDVFQQLSWRFPFSYKVTADFALALALVTDSASAALAHWETLPVVCA